LSFRRGGLKFSVTELSTKTAKKHAIFAYVGKEKIPNAAAFFEGA